jgi:transposase InsO family protein
MKKDIITMSKKQLNRFDVLSKANAGLITVHEASEALGLSERQVTRLKKKVRDEGATGVIHGNSSKQPANKISDQTKQEILNIRGQPELSTSNFEHFREKLLELHNIQISHGALHGILIANGIKSPMTRRRAKTHRRRKRRVQAGLLLQMDATPFAWFSGDKRMYALHGAIDDATGQITGLFMTKNECLHGYFETLRMTISNFGIPVSVYADRHTIFQSPNAKKHEIDASIPMNDTQFGRCLRELGVTLIAARSPQAKGRVERLWSTLQSRLPVEFALGGVKTVEEANAFLQKYLFEFNAKFAVEPQNAQSAFRKKDVDENLDNILCIKEKRVMDAGGVFSYGNKSFKIIDADITLPKKTRIVVIIGAHIGIRAEYKGKIFECLSFVPPKRKKSSDADKHKHLSSPVSPPPEHAWKAGCPGNIVTFSDRKYESEEAYNETIRLIERTLLGRNR